MKPLMSPEGVFAACTTVNTVVDKAVENAISEALLRVVKSSGGVEDMEALWKSAYSDDGQAAIRGAKNGFLRHNMIPHMRNTFGDAKTETLLKYMDTELPHNNAEAGFNLALAMYKLSKLTTPARFVSSMDTEDFKKLIRFVDAASNVLDSMSQNELEEEYRRHEALYSKQKASMTESIADKVAQTVGGDGGLGDMAKGALKFLKDKISSKKPTRSSDVVCIELFGGMAGAVAVVCILCIIGSGGMAAALFPFQMAFAVVGALRTASADEKDAACIHSPVSSAKPAKLFAGIEARQDQGEAQGHGMFSAKEEHRRSATKADTGFRNRSGGGELQGR
ncbi:hypothetical protein OC188_01835 [Anaplasma capra]|uniref:hypothetical protein n=1 Tax=Anaplasma capra TaxID=1562740 RepID=UPI0021D5B77D|nr:hypothetical protein [Anaplasma capra]MCU7611438.1 hypothetical protein [Anaplasma capra]